MFHKDEDTLRRMEEALLAEEAREAECEDEPEIDEVPDFEADDEDELVIRNFANNYRAYSNHRTDVDLEEFSRKVYEPRKKKSPATLYLALLAIVLTAGIVMVVLWWLVRLGLV